MNITAIGAAEVVKQLDNLEADVPKLYKQALFDGAGVLADEIRKGLAALPIYQKKDGSPSWGTPDKPIRGVTERQKADILANFGISRHFDEFHVVEAYIGINGRGYTEGYWRGTNEVPIAVILRSLESGSSFVQKIPTIRPAVNRSKEKAKAEMQKTLERLCKEYNIRR